MEYWHLLILSVIINVALVFIREKYAEKGYFSIFTNKKLQKCWRLCFIISIIFTFICSGYASIEFVFSRGSMLTYKWLCFFSFVFLSVFMLANALLSYFVGKIIKWIVEWTQASLFLAEAFFYFKTIDKTTKTLQTQWLNKKKWVIKKQRFIPSRNSKNIR